MKMFSSLFAHGLFFMHLCVAVHFHSLPHIAVLLGVMLINDRHKGSEEEQKDLVVAKKFMERRGT